MERCHMGELPSPQENLDCAINKKILLINFKETNIIVSSTYQLAILHNLWENIRKNLTRDVRLLHKLPS